MAISPKTFRYLFLVTLIALSCGRPAQQEGEVTLCIDTDSMIGPMVPVWAWFGYDEPNYTYMKDGTKLLSELADLSPVPVYVRCHNLLTSGDAMPALKWGSTDACTEDEHGNPVYDWSVIDSIFDTYIMRGMKPLVEIGFMPEALSVEPEPYRHSWKPGAPYKEIFTGWAYPPKDYSRWAELVYRWVRHSVDRYGEEEVRTWYWEVWNEPDIGYWQGSREEYFKLYDYSADAVKRALPGARIGGPHTTGPGSENAARFLTAFLDHCLNGINYATGRTGSPIDFIAFHAKGAPRVVDGRVRMNLGTQLRDISRGFEIVASFPELRHLPVIIGESDPEGCAACSMQDYPQNAYRNGTLYSSYTAAAFARKIALADHFGVNFRGAVTWAFEFENQPWFNGYRDLATNGVDKPVLNVFRMFGMMSGDRVKISGDIFYDLFTARDSSIRAVETDINALAVKNERGLTVMVWNYHDDNITGQSSPVILSMRGLQGKRAVLSHFRIDQDHSNSYELWKEIGSPQNPDSLQYALLEEAGKLHLLEPPRKVRITAGILETAFPLPVQAVSLIKIDW